MGAMPPQRLREPPAAAHLGPSDDPPSMPDGRPWPSQEERTLAKAAVATKLRPLGDRVVIKPTEREEMTKSGIVLPDTAKEKPQEGTVVSVGSGRVDDKGQKHALEVKKGNKVLYGKYAGTEFKIEGDELLIVKQFDILAVLEG